MWCLPVSDLFYVGRSTTKVLLKLGIKAIGELSKSDINILRSHLKSHGEVIWSFANGIDTSIIQTSAPVNKGYGDSTIIIKIIIIQLNMFVKIYFTSSRDNS